MGAAIDALHQIGAVFCSVNDIGVVERHTAVVDRGVDAWFCFSDAEFKRLSGSASAFLQRSDQNLLVTFSTTLAHLDARLALTLAAAPELSNRILLADAAASRIFETCPQRPINSLTGVLSVLTLLGTPGPIFLLGCDGVHPDQSVFDAYDQPEKLAPHRLDAMCTLHRDMIAFHENWPLLARHFERDLHLRVPAIWNCNPESHYTVFPKMPWREALATAIRLPLENGTATDGDQHTTFATPPTRGCRTWGPAMIDQGLQWPVADVASLHAAIEAFRRETTREYEWIQREALDPCFGWSITPWPPHLVGLDPAAGLADPSTASWSTLDALRAQGLCAIAGDLPTLKQQIAELKVRALEAEVRTMRDTRVDLQQQLNDARQTIADREATLAAHGERLWQLSSTLGHSRLARLAAECRAHRLRVAVYPAGGHTRELLLTTPLSEIPIVGVIDSSPDRWGTACLGHAVSSPEALGRLRPDVVVICSRSFEDEIYEQLSWVRSRGTATLRLYSPDVDADLVGQLDQPLGHRVA